MVIFFSSLYLQCVSQPLFSGCVNDHNDLYSSNPLLVRRKVDVIPLVRVMKRNIIFKNSVILLHGQLFVIL